MFWIWIGIVCESQFLREKLQVKNVYLRKIKTMNETIYLEKEFKKYCKNNNVKKDKNISDYINYVKNSNIILNSNLLQIIENILTDNDIEKLDYLKINANEVIISSDKISKDKYRAGFNKYIDFIREKMLMNYKDQKSDDFLIDKIDNVEIAELSIEPDIECIFPNTNSKYEFSYERIKEIFFLRLITQNRFNKCGVFYPISFLKQYFYKTNNI